MKLTFWKQDSIYKIFKLLKKVPRGKQVDIFLDSHPLLEDSRWIDTFVKYIRELEITICVTTKSQKLAEELTNYGITTIYTGDKSRYERVIHFVAKKLNRSTPFVSPIEYIKSKLALVAELLVLGIIVYLFWWTISPKATIYISPTTTVQPISYWFLVYPENAKPELTINPLSLARYTGTIVTSVSKTIDLQSFSTELIPARWTIRLFNTLDSEISLLAETRLVSPEKTPYTLDTRVSIPPGTPEEPWTVDVSITALDYFADGLPIGEEGNITQETQLLIEKLPESIDLQAVRGYPLQDITNGETVLSGTVVSTDIQRLEQQLLEDINQQLAWTIRVWNKDSNHLPVPLPEEIDIIVNRFVTNAQPGESASFLQWTMDVTITYPYIRKSDLEKQSLAYIKERTTEHIKKWWLSLERIDFYEPRAVASGSYILPTTLQTFWSYDFVKDTYDITAQIKQVIAWQTKEDAKNAALLFDEVHDITISISPFRYSTIPKSIEKITLKTEE
jgi:hypothetical protein